MCRLAQKSPATINHSATRLWWLCRAVSAFRADGASTPHCRVLPGEQGSLQWRHAHIYSAHGSTLPQWCQQSGESDLGLWEVECVCLFTGLWWDLALGMAYRIWALHQKLCLRGMLDLTWTLFLAWYFSWWAPPLVFALDFSQTVAVDNALGWWPCATGFKGGYGSANWFFFFVKSKFCI